jgi:hypothetical protein
LGCNLCTPHICKCNAKVDEIGIHGLSCSKSSGRFSRHTEIHYIINQSLTSIHVNSTLELNGLSRNDGKRPDGMTLVPWIKGQPLIWDVTVVDTLADSYVLKTTEVLKVLPLKWLANANIANIVQLFRQTTYLTVLKP